MTSFAVSSITSAVAGHVVAIAVSVHRLTEEASSFIGASKLNAIFCKVIEKISAHILVALVEKVKSNLLLE